MTAMQYHRQEQNYVGRLLTSSDCLASSFHLKTFRENVQQTLGAQAFR